MSLERRSFLKLTGAVATGYALQSVACKTGAMGMGNNKISENFGIQLYTLREDLSKDPKAVLQKVASYGYKQIESFEGKNGMFWGMGNKGFKSYMDELGMKIVASHADINKDFQQKADEAAAIGMQYLICPWKGPQKSIDKFKQFAEEFNQKGEICRKAGIRFAYHNHDYSFKMLDGQLPQDVMMQNTDPSLVDYEMDIYWLVTGGQDPQEWFKKYSNRFRLCHVKDRSKNPGPDNGKNMVVLGEGIIDFSSVLKTAQKNGMRYFFVEQDYCANPPVLDCVKADAEYMKKLKI